MRSKREYGDYQTPLSFAEKVCLYLKEVKNLTPSAVIEPTCGQGSFIKSSLIFNAKEYYGIEIDPKYCAHCRENIPDKRIKIINRDFFTFSTKALIKDSREILIIGNPPWVNSSTLSSLNARNRSPKTNFKNLKGLDAMTGEGDFDICENIILKLIEDYKGTNTVFSLLCKTSVARKVFLELKRTDTSFSSFEILRINADKIFKIRADACLLIVRLTAKKASPNICQVSDFDHPGNEATLTFHSGSLTKAAKHPLDGHCPLAWRQGIKHDCASILELTKAQDRYINKLSQTLDIEPNLVFPLIKSSDIKSPIITTTNRYLLLPQTKLNQDTSQLQYSLPKTYAYLTQNQLLFQQRKSSIYNNKPLFSVFGVGDYTFLPYKVIISGFYKRPLFSLAYSTKPILLDDTIYFLGFTKKDHAYTAMLILNSPQIQSLLEQIVFLDSKRPYTKKLLQRIDLTKAANTTTIQELQATERSLKLQPHITQKHLDNFRDFLGARS